MHGITGFYWFTHTCTQTYTHAQTHKQVKLLSSAKLKFMNYPLNYAYNVGMTEFTAFSVKQVVNRHAHLPKVQAPVHIVDGAPGVHHKRRPQGMTKNDTKIH